MCNMPDTEVNLMELDESLLSLFRQWKCFMCEGIDTECYEDMNLVETFCTEMSNRLRYLEKEGALEKVFKL